MKKDDKISYSFDELENALRSFPAINAPADLKKKLLAAVPANCCEAVVYSEKRIRFFSLAAVAAGFLILLVTFGAIYLPSRSPKKSPAIVSLSCPNYARADHNNMIIADINTIRQ